MMSADTSGVDYAGADETRPLIAADVQLIGEMPDVGFSDRQWLVQRSGRFIQVTEVLYRILERANGQRSLAAIAEAVTNQTDWSVDAPTIGALIETKLAPLGLVHTRAHRPTIARATESNSPVRVNMRCRVVPAEAIDPITRLLTPLFAPAAVLIALVAITTAHCWMYFQHGVATSVSDVLYTPGALLLTFGIIVLAAMIHELGHAAALRYGGGRARGIGVGLYLVFPAFFTDATDSYRLGRAARIRTDLGGIYFHLLCSTVLIGLAYVLRQDVLLFSAVLLNIEVIRQFTPFVQLDGYWLLTDLTGVPDFLSQSAAFVRSLRSPERRRGQVLPPLRPLAKAAFATYTFGVLPLFVALIAATALYLPRFFVETRDAVLVQGQLIRPGQPLLTIVLAITQIVFLASPFVASLLLMGKLASTAVTATSRHLTSPARRLTAAACAAAACALLFAGINSAIRVHSREASVGGEMRGQALIEFARRSTAETRSLEADVEGRLGGDAFTGSIVLQRPNLARVEVNSSGGLGRLLVNSDGREIFVYFPAENQYTRSPARADGRNINAFIVDQVRFFFQPETIAAVPNGGTLAAVGSTTQDGAAGEMFALTPKTPDGAVVHLFISRDGLVRRIARGARIDDPDHGTGWVALKSIHTNRPLSARGFDWQLPADATALTLPFAIPGGMHP